MDTNQQHTTSSQQSFPLKLNSIFNKPYAWFIISFFWGLTNIVLLKDNEKYNLCLIIESIIMSVMLLVLIITIKKKCLFPIHKNRWLIFSFCISLPTYLDFEFFLGLFYIFILFVYILMIIINGLIEGESKIQKIVMIIFDPIWHIIIYAWLTYSIFVFNIPG